MTSERTRPERAGAVQRPELRAGDRVGLYTLTGREIGSGGFGKVYEATHPQLELRVAIKIQDTFGDPQAHERALREAAALARIQHRNVVRIFDAGELGAGRHYLAMELLTGEPLDQVLASGPLPRDRVVSILTATAGALDAIHARGLVHRDLKPANVFLCRDDDGEIYPKLIDFGIAKDLAATDRSLTRTGAVIGTPSYMSPEQCSGEATLDARSDIYALGLLAYHMLAGRPPFDGGLIEAAHRHLYSPVPSIRDACPDLSPAMDVAFARVLAKQAADRPGAASEAAELLIAALGAPAPPGTQPTLREVHRPRRRSRLWLGVVAVLGLAGTGIAIRLTGAPAQSEPPAVERASSPIDAAVSEISPPTAESKAIVIDAPPTPPPPVDAPHRKKPLPRRPGINDVESLPSP